MDCYVYYRVLTPDTDAARLAVMRLFAMTAERFGVAGRLQWRADASANDTAKGSTTWMERYDDVSPEFLAALPQMVEASGLAAWLEGERHVECFVDIPASTTSQSPSTPCA